MTLDDFLGETGLPDRTLRHYHRNGLVPQPVGTPGDHGYGEEHLLRVFAIFRLQREGVRLLHDLKSRLDAMSLEDLRRFVHGEAPEEAAVLPAPVAPTPTEALPGPRTAAVLERHVRISLRPGILLDIRTPIDDEGQALVQRIASLCGMTVVFD